MYTSDLIYSLMSRPEIWKNYIKVDSSYKGGFYMEVLVVLLVILFYGLLIGASIALYFLPSIIAYRRKHPNKTAILIVNFLLGWTFLGWAGALVWACLDVDASKASTLTRNIGGNKYEDIARLQKLKESGAITEVEFEIEKQKLLR